MILPVPFGIFVPLVAIGAGFGRGIGELVRVWFGSDTQVLEGGVIVPGGYALVGAAAVAAGVTHTISSAVIIFELTGQLNHLIPVFVLKFFLIYFLCI